MKKPKKETRDVITKHIRWTEVLHVVHVYHPEVTIILSEEKIQTLPGDDVRTATAPTVGVIRRVLDAGVGWWHGYTETCRVRQVQLLLSHYFRYHEDCIGAGELDLLIKDLLYVHKAQGEACQDETPLPFRFPPRIIT